MGAKAIPFLTRAAMSSGVKARAAEGISALPGSSEKAVW